MDMTDIPMVRLTWKDAQDSDGTWTAVEDILEHQCATCQEVGWLVLNDSERVIMMRSRIVAEKKNYKRAVLILQYLNHG